MQKYHRFFKQWYLYIVKHYKMILFPMKYCW